MKHPMRFILVALLLGWAVDLLFWQSPVGLNFPLWTALLLAGGIFLVYAEGKRLHPAGWVLAGLALLLSLGSLLAAGGIDSLREHLVDGAGTVVTDPDCPQRFLVVLPAVGLGYRRI